MNEDAKRIIYIYFLLVAAKFLIALFIFAPLGYADSYIYMKTSQSILSEHSFLFDHVSYSMYPPLYSIIISISHIFNDMAWAVVIIKLINSLLINTIIFPIYFIAREFMSEKKSVLASVMACLIPPFVLFPAYVLSESLFYPLFVFSLFFLYRSFTTPSLKWDLLTGIFVGLSYLTKMNALVLFAVVGLSIPMALLMKMPKKHIYRKLLILMVAMAVISPWIIRNTMTYGASTSGLIGRYVDVLPINIGWNFFSRLYWSLMHFSYAIIATGIVFFLISIFTMFNKEDKKLKVLSWLSFMSITSASIVSGVHSGANADWKDAIPHGRYLAMAFPMIILIGLIAMDRGYLQRIRWRHILSITAVFILSYPLVTFSMFPVNNISMVYLGILQKMLSHKIIIALFILSPLVLLLLRKLTFKKASALSLMFFVLVSMMGYSVIAYSSNYIWYNYDVSKLGRWVNDNINHKETILYDNHPFGGNFKQETPKTSYILYSGMWFSNPIRNNNGEYDSRYLISANELGHKVLYQTEWENQTIRVYDRYS
ncbi:MAG: glycosyltransferase family 39 protein [Nanoarchaeota archaeon]